MDLDDEKDMERCVRDIRLSEKLKLSNKKRDVQMSRPHQVLLTDAEWDTLYANYPRGIPVVHPILKEFAQLVNLGPESIIEGAQQYREIAWGCRCWMCEHMLAQPVITGYHLYVVTLNRVCAGGNPRHQLN